MRNPDRIAVAMSGGVDSSTAAAALLEAGHEVIGLTMHLWDPGTPTCDVTRTCCAPEDVQDARQVADHLGIPFYVVDLETAFRTHVVADFLTAYTTGATPNPCVRCNQILKFQHLLRIALELGATSLATGHYAEVRHGIDGLPELWRGADHAKDQSYFLFPITLETLRRLRFPLGNLTKTETRALAEHYRLPVARKRDSQDLCFVPDGDYAAFFHAQGMTMAPGDIVDQTGHHLGYHRGIHHHTIGQRRGLGIAAPHPLYVVAIDPRHNRLIVGPEAALYQNTCMVHDLSWLLPEPPPEPFTAHVRIRYAAEPQPATVNPLCDGRIAIKFEVPQRAITPGQACVLYQGDRVVGGGWIEPFTDRT
jgi:tRNA-specific 2-thiouridylase